MSENKAAPVAVARAEANPIAFPFLPATASAVKVDLAPAFEHLLEELRTVMRREWHALTCALIAHGAEQVRLRLPGLPESDAAALLAAASLTVLRRGGAL